MHVKVEYFLDIQDKKKNTSLLDIPLRKKLVNFQDHADQQLNYKRLISLLLFHLYGYVKILTLDKLGKLNCRISQSACFFRSTVVEYISYIMSLCQFVILIWTIHESLLFFSLPQRIQDLWGLWGSSAVKSPPTWSGSSHALLSFGTV